MSNKTGVALLVLLLVFSLYSSFAVAQVPDIGEAGCVPVHPITGAPCPECCDGSADDYQDYPDDESEPIEEPEKEPYEEPEEECETPASRDCSEECTVVRQEEKKCVFPAWRNCRQECAGLPSYPTFEFEACLPKCDDKNLADRADYDNCVTQGTSSYHDIDDDCLKKCESQNSQDNDNYNQCVERQTKDVGTKPVTYPEEMETSDDNVDIDNINAEIEKQFETINGVFKQIAGRNAIATSGFRPYKKGQKFSYHQTGDAVDLRINDLEQSEYIDVFNKLRNELDKTYDVCLEVPDPSKLPSTVKGCVIKWDQPHIHVEYNRRKVEAARKIAESVQSGKITKFPEPPPPIITNYELTGEQEDINNPTLLKELKDAFTGKTILYDQTIKMPEGLDVRVSTSGKDVAVWGAEVVGQEVALKVAAYALPKEILETLQKDFEIISQGKSVYEISQVDPKVSGDYAVGPFTVEIKYLPELIPEAYTEDDVGLFHAVVTEGKVTFSKVKNVFVDKANNRIFGRVEGFSFYVVGILPEEAQASDATEPDVPSEKKSYFWENLVFYIILFLVIYFIIRYVRKKRKGAKMHKESEHKVSEHKKPEKVSRETKKFGIASLILAILSILFLFFPFVGIILAILAVVFSRKQNKHTPTKTATAGLVIGIIGIVLNLIALIAVIGVISSLSSGKKSAQNNKEGSSFENAIVIQASNEKEGVDKEYTYLNLNACTDKNGISDYGVQTLKNQGSSFFDVMEVICKNGATETYYFQIDSFFGKI